MSGPHPTGPSRSTSGGVRQAKGSIGLTRDKKGKTGARAGIGRPGRKPKVYRTVGTGGNHPGGAAGNFAPRVSVRLPNRGVAAATAAAKPRGGGVSAFLKRFRKG